MAVQGLQITLGSSSEQVLAGSGTHGVIRVIVRNNGSGVAYVGDTPVTTADYPLTSGDTPLALTLMGGEILYGYSTGTPTLHVLRMNDTTA